MKLYNKWNACAHTGITGSDFCDVELESSNVDELVLDLIHGSERACSVSEVNSTQLNSVQYTASVAVLVSLYSLTIAAWHYVINC